MSSIQTALYVFQAQCVAWNRHPTLRIPLCRCLERNSGRGTQGISADTTRDTYDLAADEDRQDFVLNVTSSKQKRQCIFGAMKQPLNGYWPKYACVCGFFPPCVRANNFRPCDRCCTVQQGSPIFHFALHSLSRITYVFVCELY